MSHNMQLADVHFPQGEKGHGQLGVFESHNFPSSFHVSVGIIKWWIVTVGLCTLQQL